MSVRTRGGLWIWFLLGKTPVPPPLHAHTNPAFQWKNTYPIIDLHSRGWWRGRVNRGDASCSAVITWIRRWGGDCLQVAYSSLLPPQSYSNLETEHTHTVIQTKVFHELYFKQSSEYTIFRFILLQIWNLKSFSFLRH